MYLPPVIKVPNMETVFHLAFLSVYKWKIAFVPNVQAKETTCWNMVNLCWFSGHDI
jgi:hypothetical protein